MRNSSPVNPYETILNGKTQWREGQHRTYFSHSVEGREMPPPQDVYMLTHEPCEYVPVHDKGESQLTLRWGGHSRTSDGLSVVTSLLTKERRRQESQSQGRCDAQSRAGSDATAGFAERRRDHKPWNAGASRSWKRQERTFFPRASRRHTGSPADIWILRP